MPRITLTIKHSDGLHARPASLFVQTVNKFNCEVVVICGNRSVNAKSIIGVLSLGANHGSVIEIVAEGIDAEAVLDALQSLVENNFSLQEKQPDNSSQTNEMR